MKPKTVGRATGQVPLSGHAPEAMRADYHLNGLPVGTRLWTLDGELPVEFLSPGDRIISRNAGIGVLREARIVRTTCQIVRIKAGSLGHTRPDEDMCLPATQRVLLRDWRAQALFGTRSALVPISRLVDGQFVQLTPAQDMTLVQLLFDAPHILYADGLEVESALAAPAPVA